MSTRYHPKNPLIIFAFVIDRLSVISLADLWLKYTFNVFICVHGCRLSVMAANMAAIRAREASIRNPLRALHRAGPALSDRLGSTTRAGRRPLVSTEDVRLH